MTGRAAPELVEEIGERLKTTNSLSQIARDMDLGITVIKNRARPIINAMRKAGTLGTCACGEERFHPRWCRGVSPRLAKDDHRAREQQEKRRKAILAAIMRGDTFAEIGKRHGIGHKGTSHYLQYLSPEQRERRKAIQWRRVKVTGHAATAPAHRDDLYARLASAMPRWLSPASRDDAISDAYLAVLEGRLAEKDIAAEARQFARAAVKQWESRFGPRSLDEKLSGDSETTFGDLLVDPAALDAFDYIFEEAQ